MKLSVLAAAIPGASTVGGDPEITGVAYDSRAAGPGTLFAALRGKLADGHDFIAQAAAQGAAAALIDRGSEASAAGMPYIAVGETRRSLPAIAAAFYGEPSRRIKLAGVTGTNGKTTTTYMLESIFRSRGEKTGVIGTLGAVIDGVEIPQDRTTPESPDLQRLLARMAEEGVSFAAMEVSSEGILQERTTGTAYDVGVFTNLTQDHLNTHGDMESYFAQKMRLFTEYPDASPEKDFTAVVNGDDAYGRRVVETVRAVGRKVLVFSTAGEADLVGEIHNVSAVATDFTLRVRGRAPVRIDLPLGGLFNASNAMAAAGAALALGAELSEIKTGLEAMTGVPGRFEKIDTSGLGFQVVVDYAHSPDGLDNLLRSARALNPKRVVCVFGCGGDRDPLKRPQMGKIAADLADVVVVTSDNPRSEDPASIIEAILAGIGGRTRKDLYVEPDRDLAIKLAVIRLAQPGDLVVIAGKGHETVQILKDRKIHFDDREAAREAIALCA